MKQIRATSVVVVRYKLALLLYFFSLGKAF